MADIDFTESDFEPTFSESDFQEKPPKISLSPYEDYKLSHPGPMTQFGPPNPQELLALPQILKAPSAAIEQSGIMGGIGDAAADFLRRTGINPAAQAGVSLAPTREQETYIPSPLEQAFPNVGRGLEETARGFVTPENLALAPFAGLKPVQVGFEAQMAAGVPEAIQATIEAPNAQERTQATAQAILGTLVGSKLLPKSVKSEEVPPAAVTEGEPSTALATGSADVVGEAPPAIGPAIRTTTGPEAIPQEEVSTPIGPGTLGEAEMGAAGLGEIPPTGAGGEKYGVAERVRAERAQAGQVEPIEPGTGLGPEAQVLKYREIVRNDPTAGPRALAAFEADPKKQISAELEGVTRAHGESLFNQARLIEGVEGTDSPEWRKANEVANEWDKRTKPIQTEWSEIGRGQQGETDLDSGSFTGLNRAYREYSEKDISPKDKPAAEKIAKVNGEAQKEAVDSLVLVNELFKDEPVEPHVTSLIQRITDSLDKTAGDALSRIKARRAEGRLFTGIDPLELADYAVYGASKIAKGAIDFTKWSAEMTADLGDYVKEHLKQIWDASNKHLDEAVERSAPSKERTNVRKTIRKQSTVDAERAALDAAHKTVRENAIRIADLETKERVATTVREQKVLKVQKDAAKKALDDAHNQAREAATRLAKAESEVKERARLNEQEKAATAALDGANKVVRDLAVKVAENEKKVRAKPTRKESTVADTKAIDAANKVVRDSAERLSKAENDARVAKSAKDKEVANTEVKAARKALDAANKTVRDAAARSAKEEAAKRVAESGKERAAAAVQVKAERKLLEAAQDRARKAAADVAKAERANQANPMKRVWDAVKGYLEKGETDQDSIRTKVATDLGLSTDQVYRLMARDERVKRALDDMWMKQQRARRLKQAAKRWVQGLDEPAFLKWAEKVPNAMFRAKVFGHMGVAFGTHAPAVGFVPKYWGDLARDYGKMWHMGFSSAFYERQIADLQKRKNFIPAKRFGLDNDPGRFEEYNPSGKTNMGGRSYTSLKFIRQDIFDKVWDNLPKSQQTPEVGWSIANRINHMTGTLSTVPPPKSLKGIMKPDIKPPSGAAKVAFAPTLLFSRYKFLFGDTLQDLGIMTHWTTATPAEKAAVKFDVNHKLWVAGTGLALLTANAGLLAAVNSDQKINFTDPTRSDWLKFKAFGFTFSPGNAMLTMARLIPREISMIRGGKNVRADEDAAKKAWEFARGQMSPFAGTATDLFFGTDYSGRPLPSKLFGTTEQTNKVPLRQREQGVQPYTWTEYGLQQAAPIPIQEGLKEVWHNGWGMSKEQIEGMVKAGIISGVMGVTGGRVAEDWELNKESPYK